MQADPSPLRIRVDGAALAANLRSLAAMAGVPVAAAVKADGYGLGARDVVRRLAAGGVDAFLVSTWAEAAELDRPDLTLLVLHGFRADDAATAAALPLARPVLNSAADVAAWAAHFSGRPADLMVETGMHRLGLDPADIPAALAATRIDTIHSHLATADEPGHPLTARQLACFREVAAAHPGPAKCLANSAAIALGREFAFDRVRPGIALYGGRPHPRCPGLPVAQPEARVIQVRNVMAGDTVGYGADWTATRPSRIAILNIGYADGVHRALAPHLTAAGRPVIGRVSMDMTAIDVTGTNIGEGDWLPLDWDLARLSAASPFSEYELLTGLSRRAPRIWA